MSKNQAGMYKQFKGTPTSFSGIKQQKFNDTTWETDWCSVFFPPHVLSYNKFNVVKNANTNLSLSTTTKYKHDRHHQYYL